MDVVSAQKRSEMMAGIGAKNTKPERMIRSMLFAAGYRFRLHRNDLPGTPDIVMPGRKVIIFVHGCFWHVHKHCTFSKLPRSNAQFWLEKLDGNVRRDRKVFQALMDMGWRVLLIWECTTRRSSEAAVLMDTIDSWISGDESFGEIPSRP